MVEIIFTCGIQRSLSTKIPFISISILYSTQRQPPRHVLDLSLSACSLSLSLCLNYSIFLAPALSLHLHPSPFSFQASQSTAGKASHQRQWARDDVWWQVSPPIQLVARVWLAVVGRRGQEATGGSQRAQDASTNATTRNGDINGDGGDPDSQFSVE